MWNLLEDRGPQLGQPLVDTVTASLTSNVIRLRNVVDFKFNV